MQKLPISSGGVLRLKLDGMNGVLKERCYEIEIADKEKPCSNMEVSKVEHGYILSGLITLINQVSNAGFSPKIAVIPIP